MALFTSRKPIFNKKLEVIAYELLYKDNDEFYHSSKNPMSNADTRLEMKNKMVAEHKNAANRKKAMIDFNAFAIVFELPLSMDSKSIIINVDSDVDIEDDEIQDRFETLKERGYEISLNDFDEENTNEELLQYVSFVRLDFKKYSQEELKKKLDFLKSYSVKTIAEHLEDEHDFNTAKEIGFDYFQGSFYTVPQMSKNRELDVVSNTYLRLINEWNKPTPDNKVLSEIVASDVSLSFKLLKLLNSAAFYRQTKINSVHSAIVTLGDVAFKKWLLLLMLNDMNQKKSDELVTNSILRAKFMEVIWENLNNSAHSKDSAFMVGMFSLLDAILDKNKVDIMYELPVMQDVKDAIVIRQNDLGQLLELIENIEKGKIEEIESWCRAHSYTRKQITDNFLEATTWLNLLMETGTKV